MTTKTTSLATKHHLYSEIRDSLQTGDLIATRVTRCSTFFDFVLYWYQKLFKKRFAHVAIVVREGERLFVVEAIPNMVRIVPLSKTGNFYLIRAKVKPSTKHFNLLSQHIGKPYSVLDLILSMFGIKGDDTELYCSELALDFYESIGYFKKTLDEFDERIPTPDDIVERVLQESQSEIEFVRIDKGNIYDH